MGCCCCCCVYKQHAFQQVFHPNIFVSKTLNLSKFRELNIHILLLFHMVVSYFSLISTVCRFDHLKAQGVAFVGICWRSLDYKIHIYITQLLCFH